MPSTAWLLYGAFAALSFTSSKAAVPVPCTCSDPSLCDPLDRPVLQPNEFYGFLLTPNQWQTYNWSVLTTACIAGMNNYDPDMLCEAHKHGARVTAITTGFPKEQLANKTFRSDWVASNVAMMQEYRLDGLNLDFEDWVKDPTLVAGLTALVQELNAAIKAVSPTLQFTVDVAWSPNGIDERDYDYKSIADNSDGIFVMAYDERSQVFGGGPCLAGANSPLSNAAAGLANFSALPVPPTKMILGMPWYGYRYECLPGTAPDAAECPIASTDWRNATCSDAVGSEHNHWEILEWLDGGSYITRPLQYNETVQSPYFNFLTGTPGNATVHQVWFDDPRSLGAKRDLAAKLGLAGTGVWNLDAITAQAGASAQAVRDAMYGATAMGI